MELSDRMKAYEKSADGVLMPRTPVMIRVDGRCFHTYCKRFQHPYDLRIHEALCEAAKSAMQSIMGAEIAFIQSDEISIFVKNYRTFESENWFAGRTQKIASVTASIVTAAFNSEILKVVDGALSPVSNATFDARVFNVPTEDVGNYFVWRSRDAIKNAISMFASSQLSHKELMNVTTKERLEIISEIPAWQAAPLWFKYGTCRTPSLWWETPLTVGSEVMKKILEIVDEREE